MSWTLDLVQQKALSSVTRHWNWNNGSAVERDSTLELEQRKALPSVTRHLTWNSGKRCRS